MFDRCFNALATTANGRKLTQKDKDAMRAMFSQSFLKAAADGTPGGDAVLKALQDMRAERLHDLAKKQQREILDAAAIAKMRDYVNSGVFGTKSEAVARLVATFSDAKSNIVSAESAANANMAAVSPTLHEIFKAIGTDATGFIEQQANARAFVHALYEIRTGKPSAVEITPEIKAAAKKWLGLAESQRERFNASGGDVGKLDDWVMPQAWDERVLRKLGGNDLELSRKIWSDTMLPRLNRAKYIDPETGVPMDDARLREFLNKSFDSIAGIDDAGGIASSVKNRESASRQIHIDGPDAWIELQERFGKSGVIQGMNSHARQMATNIAIVEKLGPSATRNVETLLSEIAKEVSAGASLTALKKEQYAGWRAKAMLNELLSSVSDAPASRFSDFMQGWRNLNMVKLGGAYISSITDHGSMMQIAAVNKASGLELFHNNLKNLNPLDKTQRLMLEQTGLMSEVLAHQVYRDGKHMLRSGFTGAVSGMTMKLSMLSQATNARTAALEAVLMNAVGKKLASYSTLADIKGADGKILRGAGVKEQDWAVWKLATPEKWGSLSDTMLTPASINAISDQKLTALGLDPAKAKRQAVESLFSYLNGESSLGVLKIGAKESSAMRFGLQKGTVAGEIASSVMQFKSFPIGIIMKQQARAIGLGGKSGAGYFAGTLLSLTLMGAIALQAKQLIAGKDAQPVDDPRFWFKAMLTGGTLGLYGDVLFSDKSSLTSTFLGPSIGSALDTVDILTRPARAVASGKEFGEEELADMGGDIVRQAKGYNPLSTLWYTKGAFDHIFTHNLQEALSPGYLSRMQSRTAREYGQGYWWRPGEALPDRLPEMAEGR